MNKVGSSPTVEERFINKKLLLEVMDYIETHPQQWMQDVWYYNGVGDPVKVSVEFEEVNSCSTSFCFAGHAALKEGFPEPPKQNGHLWQRHVDGEIYPEDAAIFAQKRLGIHPDVADELFDEGNTMENLRDMVTYLVGCADSNIEPDWRELVSIREAE